MSKPKKKLQAEALNIDIKEIQAIIDKTQGVLSKAELEKLQGIADTLLDLQNELRKKNATLYRLRAMIGMVSSEKTKEVLPKPQTDSTPDSGDPKSGSAPASKERKPRKEREGHGRKKSSDYTSAELVRVPHESLKSGDPCPSCTAVPPGVLYDRGRPRRWVRLFGQPPVGATIFEFQDLRCGLCREIFRPEPPEGAQESKYDASCMAMIAYYRYGMGIPMYRLQTLQEAMGIPLPDSTQWDLVASAADVVEPVHAELINRAAQGEVIHNDDTSMRVLKLREELQKLVEKGESKRTGIHLSGILSVLPDAKKIALYFTGKNHAGENLTELLRRRSPGLPSPIQMCDGLNHNAPTEFDTIMANCLAHARRKFVENVESFPEECERILKALRDVYIIDARIKSEGLSAEDRLREHQIHSKPLMDSLRSWMQEQMDTRAVEPNSALGGAIQYMMKRWEKLTRFLQVAGAPLDNNACERALRKAVLHRRNSKFYRTENGAKVGDRMMCLIHTAELAGENPFDYLTHLLRNEKALSEHPERWLPWNYRDNPSPATEVEPADDLASLVADLDRAEAT